MSEEIIAAAKDTVAAINYVLTNAEGTVLDQSEGEPLEYLQGHNNIITGLEEAMEGKKPGDKFKVTIPAAKAYGELDPARRFAVKREEMGIDTDPKVGMMARLSTDEGTMIARIVEVNSKEIVFDANHPLAGVDLTFDVEVVSVRKATEEEIAQGGLHSSCGGDCHSCGGCH